MYCRQPVRGQAASDSVAAVAYCGRPRRQHDFEGHAEDIVHVLDELEHADDLLRNLPETETTRCRVTTRNCGGPGMDSTPGFVCRRCGRRPAEIAERA